MNTELKSRRDSARLLVAGGAILCMFALLVGLERLLPSWKLYFAARGWLEVSARVAELRVTPTGNTVDYRYNFGGAHYGSTCYSISGKQPDVSRLLPGTEISCFINPASPADAVIDRSIPYVLLPETAICLTFASAGIALLISGMRHRFSRS